MDNKVFYIISDISKALAFEWIWARLDKTKAQLHFIVLGESSTSLIAFLTENRVPYYFVPLSGKSGLPWAWWKVLLILRKEKPDVVHTHLYYANWIGLSAAWLLGIPRRIHTRHHGALHHHYFPRSVYFDKIINKLSTDIIVLCSRQREILLDWEKTPEGKLHFIPHGFDLDYFRARHTAIVEKVRREHRIPGNVFPVVGIIARYTEWKGVHYIIPAFKQLLATYPGAHLVLANAAGDYTNTIKAMLRELPTGSYTEIIFEPSLAALYHVFDLYVHAPVDEYAEAFGQTYVEALAAGVPSVVTLSGIACDFIEHKTNAWVVPYRDVDALAAGMINVLGDATLQADLIARGRESVTSRFSIREMVQRLEALYDR